MPKNIDGDSLPPNPLQIREFFQIISAQAVRAFNGVADPGLLQLSKVHPEDPGLKVVGRFSIDDVDGMTAAAIAEASNGFNVYVEGRTVRRGLVGNRRGSDADTLGVFALVVDSDGDKGKASQIEVPASLVVESSPGNAHLWLFLERGLTVEQARPLGDALRSATGSDSDTGKLDQPYRVAGTPNFPNAKKQARGRVVTATRIVAQHPRLWSVGQLATAFPAVERAAASYEGPQGATGRSSSKAERILATPTIPGADRSGLFFQAVLYAFADGLSPSDFEALCLKYPQGPAGRFATLEALRRDIERSFAKAARPLPGKLEPQAQQISVAPKYPDNARPVNEARAEVKRAMHYFSQECQVHESWLSLGGEKSAFPVMAIRVATGVGKTTEAITLIADDVKARRAEYDTRPVVYAVPRHALGDEIVAKFEAQGIRAKVFRGRAADDPDRPGQQMCDDLEAVKAAIELGASVGTSCCSGKTPTGKAVQCPFFNACSYQRQKVEPPEVWIIAHQLLFHKEDAIREVARVFVDESFWQAGVRISKKGLSLEQIESPISFAAAGDDLDLVADLEASRQRLAQCLRSQTTEGGVAKAALIDGGLTVEECVAARSLEWKLKREVHLYPGMSQAERRAAIAAAKEAKHTQRFAHLWDAAQHLLEQDEGAISGRITLGNERTEHGLVRVVKTQGVRKIATQWRVPTMIMDATLPDPTILRAFYPNVQVLTEIEAQTPHARVRQVINAPVSKRKLGIESRDFQPMDHERKEANRNASFVLRYIRKRWEEFGRAKTLVIAQKGLADWMRESGLPESIAIEHFNDIAGIDRHRDVRLLISIGRVIPSTAEVERNAGALTGIEPRAGRVLENGSKGYDKVLEGIRTTEGQGVPCATLRHPDPAADAVLWQICEGELLQAIGRGRAVNRTAADPLQIDIVADVILPITVAEVVQWDSVKAGKENEMILDGFVIESPADMAQIWPQIWPTRDAAKSWLNREMISGSKPYRGSIYGNDPEMPEGWVRIRYRPVGRGQQTRSGFFNPSICPDPQAWLEARLGPLAVCDYEMPAPVVQEVAQADKASIGLPLPPFGFKHEPGIVLPPPYGATLSGGLDACAPLPANSS